VPGWARGAVWESAPYAAEGSEKEHLKRHANALQAELEAVKKRLDEVETETAPE
jgi:hypothetical protein